MPDNYSTVVFLGESSSKSNTMLLRANFTPFRIFRPCFFVESLEIMHIIHIHDIKI